MTRLSTFLSVGRAMWIVILVGLAMVVASCVVMACLLISGANTETEDDRENEYCDSEPDE